MDVKTVTTIYGLVGTLAIVSATVMVAWITQRTVTRRELIRDEIRMRQELYGEFVAECARLFMDAFQHSLEKPETFVPVYGLINRIRLCSTQAVLIEAERLVTRITDQYFSEKLSVEELRQLAGNGAADPLKAFGEACRNELKTVRARA